MTPEEEITELRKEVNRLQNIIDSSKFSKVDLGLSSHVSCGVQTDFPYSRQVYRVQSKKITTDFIADTRLLHENPDYLKQCALRAEYDVKKAFIKEAFSWLMETEPFDLDGTKVYLSTEIPKDCVILHPAKLDEFRAKLMRYY